jgi:hypothetical protein
MYKYNVTELILFLFIVIIVVVISIHKRRQFTSYKITLGIFFSGISWLILSCVFNSFAVNRWDKEIVFDFLLLKNGWWLYRQFALFGYAHFIWGILVLFLTKRNKVKKKENINS